MISSIIRRYKLYRKDMDFIEIHTDTHSFLMTKVDKFKPAKEKKAYSYFGTICKNYLMGQIIKDQKETNRKISYEDISSSIEERSDMIYRIDDDIVETDVIINEYLKELKEFIENFDIKRVSLGGPVFDLSKLEWMNGNYLRGLDDEELTGRLVEFLDGSDFWNLESASFVD